MTSRLEKLARRIRYASIEPQPEVSYQASRARRENAAAAMARLEVQRRASELVDIAGLRLALGEIAAMARAALEPLPGQITPAIRAANGDVYAIAAILERSIHDALNALADRLERSGAG